MIRYEVTKQQLETLINTEKPGWLARAAARTNDFRTSGQYDEASGIWSEIKPVYMRLQYSKCAYCERQLESEEFGRIEHDLEHFRPKKKARPWAVTVELTQAGVSLTPPVAGSADPGYHLLAYHPQNYCTSCKPCNSPLKSDNFPIEDTRLPAGDDPVQLSSELPYLVNPVGDFDDRPEDLIGFHGISPMAIGSAGFKKRRGLVCIKFFRLDDRRRKYLFRERASIIISLYSFLKHRENSVHPSDVAVWQSLAETYQKSSAPHANCARSFQRLFDNDQQEAQDIFDLAREYLGSISE